MAGAAHLVALLNVLILAQKDHADVVFLKIHDHAAQLVAKLHHLAGHDVAQPSDTADTVGERGHTADLVAVQPERHGGKLPFDALGGALGAQVGRFDSLLYARESVRGAAVIDAVAYLHADTAQKGEILHKRVVERGGRVDALDDSEQPAPLLVAEDTD